MSIFLIISHTFRNVPCDLPPPRLNNTNNLISDNGPPDFHTILVGLPLLHPAGVQLYVGCPRVYF